MFVCINITKMDIWPGIEDDKALLNFIELNFIIKLHMCRYESQAYNMH